MLNTFTEYLPDLRQEPLHCGCYSRQCWAVSSDWNGQQSIILPECGLCAGLSRGGGLCHRKYLSGDGFRNRADRLKPYSGRRSQRNRFSRSGDDHHHRKESGPWPYNGSRIVDDSDTGNYAGLGNAADQSDPVRAHFQYHVWNCEDQSRAGKI